MIFRLRVMVDYERGKLNSANKRDTEKGVNFLIKKLDFKLTGKDIDPEESRCNFNLARVVNDYRQFQLVETQVIKLMQQWRESEGRDLEAFSYEITTRNRDRN